MCLVRAIFASRYQNLDRLAAQRDAGRIDHGRYGAEHRIRPSCVDVVVFPFDRRQLLRRRPIRLLQVLWAELRVHTLHAENQIAPPRGLPSPTIHDVPSRKGNEIRDANEIVGQRQPISELGIRCCLEQQKHSEHGTECAVLSLPRKPPQLGWWRVMILTKQGAA